MGGSKQTQTQQQQATTTTQLPQWITDAGQSLYNKASQQQPLGAYQGQMTAGTSQNQQAASAMARQNAGNWQGDLNTARNMTNAAAGAGPASVGARDVDAASMRAANQGYTGYTAATAGGGAPSVTSQNVDAGSFGGAQATQYMNPYQQQVQQNTLREMDRQNAMDHQALNDSVQGAKAYGGARQALLESEQAKNQAQARTDYIDKSNADAYSNAQQQFNTDRAAQVAANTGNADRALQAGTTNASFLDQLLGRQDAASQFNAGAANTAAGANADRQQQAGQFNANSKNTVNTANADRNLQGQTTNANLYESMLDRLLKGGAQSIDIGNAASGLGSNDVKNLSATGAVDQATQQAGLDAKYQDWLRAGNAPLENYKDLMSILSGVPRNVTTTGTSSGSSTTQQSGGLLNALLGAGQIAGSIWSDPRLKKNAHLIERLSNGLGVYLYRYLWDDTDSDPHVGVMADEVERIAPEALGPIVGGFRSVNYSKLEGMLA